MSAENKRDRRDFLKAAATAGIIGTAGCSSGANPDKNDGSNPNNGTSDEGKDPSNIGNENPNDYELEIEPGEEFEFLVDPGHIAANKRFSDVYTEKSSKQALNNVSQSIHRNYNYLKFLDQDQVAKADEVASKVMGRGFANAPWSDEVFTVEQGLGEIGFTRLLTDPEEIESELKANFTKREDEKQDNGITSYRGTFKDRRYENDGASLIDSDELEYDVIIGHEGKDIIWAANRPENSIPGIPPLFTDLKDVYSILEDTNAERMSGKTGDGLKSLMEGDRLPNRAMKQMRVSLEDNKLWASIALQGEPREVDDEDYNRVGDYLMIGVKDDNTLERSSGYITKTGEELDIDNNQYYDFEIDSDNPEDLKDLINIRATTYSIDGSGR